MKRIFAIALALFCAASFGATLNPIQLLNPSGSSSGQAIISTGASSAPIWANPSIPASATITNPSITGGTANNMIVGGTTPAAAAFTTIVMSGSIKPSSTAGIIGTTLANNAQAGSIGEYVSGSTAGTSITSGSVFNAASIALTAGDWDVSGEISYVPAGTTTMTTVVSGINTTSVTVPAIGSGARSTVQAAFPAGLQQEIVTPTVRINVSVPTTIYLIGFASFANSTCAATGNIRARRMR